MCPAADVSKGGSKKVTLSEMAIEVIRRCPKGHSITVWANLHLNVSKKEAGHFSKILQMPVSQVPLALACQCYWAGPPCARSAFRLKPTWSFSCCKLDVGCPRAGKEKLLSTNRQALRFLRDSKQLVSGRWLEPQKLGSSVNVLTTAFATAAAQHGVTTADPV